MKSRKNIFAQPVWPIMSGDHVRLVVQILFVIGRRKKTVRVLSLLWRAWLQ